MNKKVNSDDEFQSVKIESKIEDVKSNNTLNSFVLKK